MLVRILDLGKGGKQETKKKFQRKDWNQQEAYLTNDVSLETNQGHHSEGQVRGWEGRGGAGFSTGIHYCPTTDIKLVSSSPNSKNYCQKRKKYCGIKSSKNCSMSLT